MQSIDITQLLFMLLPILLIQFGLAIYALVDISRREKVRGSKTVWAVALVLTAFGFPTGIIASGLYLAWGRQVEESNDTN